VLDVIFCRRTTSTKAKTGNWKRLTGTIWRALYWREKLKEMGSQRFVLGGASK